MKQVQGLDAFRSNRAQEIGDRWQQIRSAHDAAAKRMWLGAVVTEFDEFELAVLRDMGFLSPLDEAALTKAGRGVQP